MLLKNTQEAWEFLWLYDWFAKQQACKQEYKEANQHCWLDAEDWIQKADNEWYDERDRTERREMKNQHHSIKTKVTWSDSQTWRYSPEKWSLDDRTWAYVIWTSRERQAIHESQWYAMTEHKKEVMVVENHYQRVKDDHNLFGASRSAHQILRVFFSLQCHLSWFLIVHYVAWHSHRNTSYRT